MYQLSIIGTQVAHSKFIKTVKSISKKLFSDAILFIAYSWDLLGLVSRDVFNNTGNGDISYCKTIAVQIIRVRYRRGY